MVRLLTSITEVEYQKALGIENDVHPGCSRLTIYALVSPANIMMILPSATHNVNLWGCIFFRWSPPCPLKGELGNSPRFLFDSLISIISPIISNSSLIYHSP